MSHIVKSNKLASKLFFPCSRTISHFSRSSTCPQSRSISMKITSHHQIVKNTVVRTVPLISSQIRHKTISFKLADIGEGITEVELVQWFIQEGQKIKQFDKVAEVMSDKANVEITSRYDGVVTKLHYPKGGIAFVCWMCFFLFAFFYCILYR